MADEEPAKQNVMKEVRAWPFFSLHCKRSWLLCTRTR